MDDPLGQATLIMDCYLSPKVDRWTSLLKWEECSTFADFHEKNSIAAAHNITSQHNIHTQGKTTTPYADGLNDIQTRSKT
jgi:hypothetical protein